MRALLVAGLVAASSLLAGCASDPPAFPPATFPPAFAPERATGGMQPVSLALGTFALAPGAPAFSIDVPVPEGVAKILVNVTFENGASHAFQVQFGACQRALGGPVVATGQTVGTDCGAMAEGSETLRLDHMAGHVGGRVEVVAWVCGLPGHRVGCP